MNPSFEELLAHGAFLRGLACALLRDEQGAEDVVQDTYVAALRRPPARHAPGAWLAVVARNLARRRRRTELRRGQRERATARTEGLPSTAEVAAQVELQEKVAAAVGALGEPYRSAVVLRFYYGRTPTEIAGEQGIPVETVKTQLKRAIQMLRARLDRTIGERAWAPLLTVLVTERAGIPMGVVLMTKKSVLAVVAVLLLVGLTFLFLVQNDSPAPERVSAARGAAPVLERPPSGSESEAEVPRKGRGAAPGEAGSSVAGRDETTIAKQPMVSKSTRGGRIISERGGVVPGVHVVIEVDRHRTVVFSSADGTIEVLQEMPKGSMRVGFATWPAKENYYLRTAVPVFEGIEQDADGAPTLRFEGIAGQVLDPDGKPASEGFVVARLESDRTIVAHAPIAGSGWFAFYGLREGEFHLSYKPKSIYSGEHAVEGGWNVRGGTMDVLLRLGSWDAIEGIVFDPQGLPKMDIYVRAQLGEALTGAATGPEGRFRIEKLEPGTTYRLTVWATGYVPESREVPTGAKDVRFNLDPGLEATGRILDPDGTPKSVGQLLVRTEDGRPIRSY
ncbi:MAG: sigma-70 family RNA polymerase sigma factor, partial [Planctomycetota bacterium]